MTWQGTCGRFGTWPRWSVCEMTRPYVTWLMKICDSHRSTRVTWLVHTWYGRGRGGAAGLGRVEGRDVCVWTLRVSALWNRHSRLPPRLPCPAPNPFLCLSPSRVQALSCVIVSLYRGWVECLLFKSLFLPPSFYACKAFLLSLCLSIAAVRDVFSTCVSSSLSFSPLLSCPPPLARPHVREPFLLSLCVSIAAVWNVYSKLSSCLTEN